MVNTIKMEEKISIVIPIYNVEAYIEECIESVLAQTYKNLEILLIDDGSTDSSGYLCDCYAKKDKRISSVHKVNEGVAVARNVGITRATADWIMFVDGDDAIHPRLVEVLVSFIGTDIDLIISQYSRSKDILTSQKGSLYNTHENAETVLLTSLCPSCYTQELEFASLFKYLTIRTPWGKLYNLKKIKKSSLWYEKGIIIREDALFNAFFLNEIEGVSFVDFYGYYYRPNEKSAINQSYNEKLLENEYAVIKVFERLETKSNEVREAWRKNIVRLYIDVLINVVKTKHIKNKKRHLNFILSKVNFYIQSNDKAEDIFIFSKQKIFYCVAFCLLKYHCINILKIYIIVFFRYLMPMVRILLKVTPIAGDI